MQDKLREVEARFEELGRRLLEPDVMRNSTLMRDLGKEHRLLSSIVEAYRRVSALESEIAGHRALLTSETDGEILQLVKDELGPLVTQLAAERQALTVALLPKDPNDDKNVILELRSGTGGDEAALFCGELFRAYARLAERRGWRVEVLSQSAGAAGGLKEVVALVEGDGSFAALKYESGVHRVQRVPATETQGRIHTSAITVAVLPEVEDVDVTIHDRDIRVDVYRSSGPGGQSVNTTDSAVRVTHLASGLVVSCQDEKSQHKNKAKALKVLRARLFDLMQAEQDALIAAERREQVKTGDRSEKVRTYNFPQDRLTDHRIGLTVHNLPKVMQGELDEVILALREHYQAAMLQAGNNT